MNDYSPLGLCRWCKREVGAWATYTKEGVWLQLKRHRAQPYNQEYCFGSYDEVKLQEKR